jgi:hypothetical protein
VSQEESQTVVQHVAMTPLNNKSRHDAEATDGEIVFTGSKTAAFSSKEFD